MNTLSPQTLSPQASAAAAHQGALFSVVMVANRGEIACRVIRTLRRLGITSVAVYSDADTHAEHVRLADRAVRVGPAAAAQSYLNIPAMIRAATISGAEAVHPGYGFLAENAGFARACAEAGVTFIGPGEQALQVMGDKIVSKSHVEKAGIPLVPGAGEPGFTDAQLIGAAQDMRYPLLIKPSAGGGGKGMTVVERREDLSSAIVGARRVARAAFGDDTLLLEQLIRSPRHIEVQVLADRYGRVIHLGERECTLQRRHQKVIEEAPSSLLDERTRHRIGQAACDTARSVDYEGAGTVEFLVSDQDPSTFYFMEMNTRLQVEHPVTEEITGVDLVEQQIRIAAGQPLTLAQEDITLTGHSVEARVYAEDAEAGFMPSSGTILAWREPSGPGIRVDSGVRVSQHIGIDYDPMVAKIIATGADRGQAFDRLRRALGETVVLGLSVNTEFLGYLAADPEVLAGQMDTSLIERRLPDLSFSRPDRPHAAAAALFAARHWGIGAVAAPGQRFPDHHTAGPAGGLTAHGPQGWRTDGWRAPDTRPASLQVQYTPVDVSPSEPVLFEITTDRSAALVPEETPGRFRLITEEQSRSMVIAAGADGPDGLEVWVAAEHFTGPLRVLDHQAQTRAMLGEIEAEAVEAVPEVTAPMPGTVVAVAVASGERVAAGELMVTIEAMKMEHRLQAPLDGIAHISVSVGDQVSFKQVLARIETPREEPRKDTEGHDQ